ncbi:cation:proton antiporter subunit C [Corynebacterium sp. HMSC27B11]|nr:cation:proton antiporter subunit C [Corynebacterium sp. HMSC27B11]OFS18467.1 cation:proton antiporter [Corynebacterium sp. HMSC27B11]
MILAAIIAILVGGGVYLILQRGMLRQILGLSLISHGVNLMILGAGVPVWRSEPLMNRTSAAEAGDPLPQAFVLTAIVISMAATAVMLALAAVGRDDDTASAEDPERAARTFRGLSTLSRHTDTEQVAKDAEQAAAAKHTPQADTLGAPYGKGGPHGAGSGAGNSTNNGKEER